MVIVRDSPSVFYQFGIGIPAIVVSAGHIASIGVFRGELDGLVVIRDGPAVSIQTAIENPAIVINTASGVPPRWNDVTSDIDIYRTANVLIRDHGDKAAIHAAIRADEMLDVGDRDGQRVWMRIIEAIETLIRNDEPVH